jgi:1-acyl-sn-glycerol-3-phosphate acyltransferase
LTVTYIRSFVYNVFMVLSATLFATLISLAYPLPFRASRHLATAWARLQMWALRRLCGLRYRVHGRSQVPKGAAIILAKHQSAWETIAFQAIFPHQTWVLKRELIWIPVFGWALAALRSIAIDRGSGRRAVAQMVAQGTERLKEGIWVVVFPEGTRVAPGQHKRYGIGGGVLAAGSGFPVVPVAHNAGSFWPRRGFLKKPGTIDVLIGPVIHSEGKSAEEIVRAAERWIEGEMARLEPAVNEKA